MQNDECPLTGKGALPWNVINEGMGKRLRMLYKQPVRYQDMDYDRDGKEEFGMIEEGKVSLHS